MSAVSPDNQPAWSDADLDQAKNPHDARDKARRVREMFAAIAPSYDLNNRVHAMGRDQAWRRKAVRLAAPESGERVLDCACGTGDLTLSFLKTLEKKQGVPVATNQVVGLDFTQEMLDHAGHKTGAARCTWVQGDAMALPFEDASFDVVSIAFGIRNVQNPAQAVAEFFRVLKPGGRLVILEFDRPRGVIGWFYRLYFTRIMPRTAGLIARDRSGAYKYLPKSVDTFLDRQGLGQMIQDAGFALQKQQPLTCGIAVAHLGMKG